MRILSATLALALASTLYAAPKPKAGAPASAPRAAGNLLIDDFEAEDAKIGGKWWVGCDELGKGTKVGPVPFVASKGGAEGKMCGRIYGVLGAGESPWPWAGLSINVPNDLSAYRALQFWARGDGKTHSVRLEKKSVTDHAHFVATFVAGPKWAKVTIPISEFKQAEWGVQVDRAMNDVEMLIFYPTAYSAKFDFAVDSVTLLK
jgi:hypothetical protein